MALVSKPRIRDVFSTSAMYNSTFPRMIGMARTRFRLILRYLHLADNSLYVPRDQPGYDPLFKIRPVVDHLLTKFHLLYTPFANLTVDEAMCPYRGRIHFRVYMKNKITKYGFRIECVCESAAGILCNMEVY